MSNDPAAANVTSSPEMNPGSSWTATLRYPSSSSSHASSLFSLNDSFNSIQGHLDPKLDAQELIRVFNVMLLTRILDTTGYSLQRSGDIGFYLSCQGHEASQLGAAHALAENDIVFPSYRQQAVPLLLAKAGELERTLQLMKNQCFGNEGDPTGGRQMPCHYSLPESRFVSYSSVIGTQLPHAVGWAMAAKLRSTDQVALTFIGDGGTSSNGFHSALNMAGVNKAPVVFICENNQWAISVPTSEQTASESMAIKALAYGIPGIRVFGNDFIQVYSACKEAVDRARRGEGPTLIETLTYRVAPHTTSDGDQYRTTDIAHQSIKEWWSNHDPIVLLGNFLAANNLLSADDQHALRVIAQELVDKAVKEARKLGKPEPGTLFDGVYATKPRHLAVQASGLESRLKTGGAERAEGKFPI